MAEDAETAVRRALLLFARCREDNDIELDDLLAGLIDEYGWPPVNEGIFRALESNESELWGAAVSAIWSAVLDRRTMDSDRAIALIYHRLDPVPSDLDDNLAWGIASRLKGVGYLSDYDPLSDPGVVAQLAKLSR